MVGIIGKDIISFDNMLEMGVKVIFAKDGTDAYQQIHCQLKICRKTKCHFRVGFLNLIS